MPRAFNSLSSRNKFAKRHYEAIALAMQSAKKDAYWRGDDACTAINVAIQCLADAFTADNGQFKRDRFERACVPGANVRARSNGGAR
jgi:hypothetical protein